MKECLNCKKEYEAKRPHAKFCSVNCRVQYNRTHPKDVITKTQVQVLYNQMLEMMSQLKQEPEIRVIAPIPTKAAIKLHNAENADQLTTSAIYDYEGLKSLIKAATSSYDLEKAWKIVRGASFLASWQLRELTKLKENQQTKLDF